jgi:hypothetical protein
VGFEPTGYHVVNDHYKVLERCPGLKPGPYPCPGFLVVDREVLSGLEVKVSDYVRIRYGSASGFFGADITAVILSSHLLYFVAKWRKIALFGGHSGAEISLFRYASRRLSANVCIQITSDPSHNSRSMTPIFASSSMIPARESHFPPVFSASYLVVC